MEEDPMEEHSVKVMGITYFNGSNTYHSNISLKQSKVVSQTA